MNMNMISKLGVFTLGFELLFLMNLGFELLAPIIVDIHLSHQRMSLWIHNGLFIIPYSNLTNKKGKNPPSVGLRQKSTLPNGKIIFDPNVIASVPFKIL